MKTNKLKMIMTIFFTIFILCILSLTVNATNEEIEILEKLEEGEKKYIIYISTDSEFEFAFSDNSATEIDDLVFLPSVTDTNGNNVAYIDSTMSATTYLWVKNTTNNTMLIKGLKVDLTDTVTDSIVDEIADITKRIKVDMTKKNKEEKWVEQISLKAAIDRLSQREHRIIELRYFEGKTQMEVAQEIGISQAQVSRLEKAALSRIKAQICSQ